LRQDTIGTLLREGSYSGEVKLRCKDGTYIFAEIHSAAIKDAKGEFSGTVTSFRNNSDVRRPQREVEEARTHLQTVMRAKPISIFICDEKGSAVLTNSAFFRIWSSDAVLPKSLEDLNE
jgi:PAS domain-containing protein